MLLSDSYDVIQVPFYKQFVPTFAATCYMATSMSRQQVAAIKDMVCRPSEAVRFQQTVTVPTGRIFTMLLSLSPLWCLVLTNAIFKREERSTHVAQSLALYLYIVKQR